MTKLTGNIFDPDTDIPDLSSKVYVVTGGSAGIGFGIVAHLLQHNAERIQLLSNKKQHAEEAMEELEAYGDTGRVKWIHCDLSDLKKTDEVAKQLLREEKHIDALICNAGLGVGTYTETTDGLDSHFQVNHLSQMHLFLTLLPVLQSTSKSRLVLQSSDLHRAAAPSTAFDSLADINKNIGPTLLYSRTKLCQVLFVRAMKRRMDEGKLGFKEGSSMFVNATHPGAVSTDQPEQAVAAYGTLGYIGVKATRPFMKDPVKQGCRSALYAACSHEIVSENINGEYIVPDKKVMSPSSKAQDVELGEKLWVLSMQILREKLGILGYES